MAFVPELDPSDARASGALIDRLTSDAAAVQRNVLDEILARNARTTEYLRRFLDGLPAGASAADLREAFKKRVPVSCYDDIKPYVDRVAAGEPSSVLCANPITGLLKSTGTSGGKQKLMPTTAEEHDRKLFFFAVRALVSNMHLRGGGEGKGLGMYVTSIYPEEKTSCGLPIQTALTAYYKSSQFRDGDMGGFDRCTGPLEAVLCPDGEQSMYCQLLCGLLRRHDVGYVGANFSVTMVRAIRFLEDRWEEMCSNVRTGRLSGWITDAALRRAVADRYLRAPDPALADEIASLCAAPKPWHGIVGRLWPAARYVAAIATGSMAQYVRVLQSYGAGLPLVSSMYGSTECLAGINLSPLDPPSQASYALLPNIAYFEFRELADHGDHGKEQGVAEVKVVDLVDVKVGRTYELIVTTFAGLYRYRVGDLLTVSGFHNAAPLFHFSGRHDVVLCIGDDMITEKDLLKAIAGADELHLRPIGYMLVGATACTDLSTLPGRHVLFWELLAVGAGGGGDHQAVMERCCLAVEERLDEVYRRDRGHGLILPLEIRVVENGAFDALMDFFVARGASVSQYKTPTAVRSKEAVAVLEERVAGRFFSPANPQLS